MYFPACCKASARVKRRVVGPTTSPATWKTPIVRCPSVSINSISQRKFCPHREGEKKHGKVRKTIFYMHKTFFVKKVSLSFSSSNWYAMSSIRENGDQKEIKFVCLRFWGFTMNGGETFGDKMPLSWFWLLPTDVRTHDERIESNFVIFLHMLAMNFNVRTWWNSSQRKFNSLWSLMPIRERIPWRRRYEPIYIDF